MDGVLTSSITTYKVLTEPKLNLSTKTLTESLVISRSVFNQVRQEFREQIYSLLEQSKLDKIKKDKPSNRLEPKPQVWDKKSFKQIIKDVVSNLNDRLKMGKDYSDYDRNGFIKMLLKNDGERLEFVYSTDIETICTLIIQVKLFGEIKYYDDVDGEDLRKKYRIEEQ